MKEAIFKLFAIGFFGWAGWSTWRFLFMSPLETGGYEGWKWVLSIVIEVWLGVTCWGYSQNDKKPGT